MITEEQKYRAYTFNVIGLALMTPFGRIFIAPVTICKEFGIFGFIGYLCFCFIVLLIGLYAIEIGRDILDKGR